MPSSSPNRPARLRSRTRWPNPRRPAPTGTARPWRAAGRAGPRGAGGGALVGAGLRCAELRHGSASSYQQALVALVWRPCAAPVRRLCPALHIRDRVSAQETHNLGGHGGSRPADEPEGAMMSLREEGLRRATAVTIGIAAASAIGSGAVAAIAWADTQAARAATSTSSGTSSSTSGGTSTSTSDNGTSGSSTSDSSTSDSGPSVSTGNGTGQATSGG